MTATLVASLADLPLWVLGREVRLAAVGEPAGRLVVEAEHEVRQEAHATRVGVLADHHQRVLPGSCERHSDAT
jgi:hypothetical protein